MMTIRKIALSLALDHAEDPLVRAAGVSPDDADAFDGLARELRAAGLPSDDVAVSELRRQLRAALRMLANG